MNIVFNSIQIENFQSIRYVNLEFAQGIYYLTGKNEDDDLSESNGSGKSSIFDAILWCLYGVSSKGLPADSYVNRYSKGGCIVQLSLSVNNETYIITRTRLHSQYGNSLTIFSQTLQQFIGGRTIKLQQDVINNLIKLDYTLFSSIVIFTQGLANKFTSLSNANQKSLFESFRDYSFWDNLYEKVNAKLKETNDNILKITSSNSLLLKEIDSLNSELAKIEAISFNGEEIEIQNKLERYKLKLEHCIQLLEDANYKFVYIQTQKDNFLKEKYRLENQIKDYSKLLNQQICPVCKQPITPDTSQSVLRQFENSLNEHLKNEHHFDSLNELLELVSTLKKQKSTILENIDNLQKALIEINYKKGIIEKRDYLLKKKAELELQIESNKAQLAKLEFDLINLKFLSTCLGNIGIKNFLFIKDINCLNSFLKQHSFKLFSNSFVAIEPVIDSGLFKNFEIYLVNSTTGLKESYISLSGGQRRRVDILIQLAINFLVTKIYGIKINLLVFDEIFDNLDSIGIDSTISLIRELYENSSVFIVSQRTDLAINFDNRIHIVKKNGLSTLQLN